MRLRRVTLLAILGLAAARRPTGEPGCWRFTLSWAGHTDVIALRYRGRLQSSTVSGR